MLTELDFESERGLLVGADHTTAEQVQSLQRVVALATEHPDDPRPRQTLLEALAEQDHPLPFHVLAAVADLATSADRRLSEPALEGLLEHCANDRVSHPEGFYQLSKVLRSGGEAEAARALEFLQGAIADTESRSWTAAVQAIGSGRASSHRAVAVAAVETLEPIVRSGGQAGKVAYEAICYTASDPHPDVAEDIERIKATHRPAA